MPTLPDSLLEPIVTHVRQQIRTDVMTALDAALGTGPGLTLGKPARGGLTIHMPKAKLTSAEANPAAILAHLRKHPGSSAGDLRTALGADPIPALAKLRESKSVRTKGQRRGTRYSVASR